MKCALCIFANVQNCKRLGDKWMSPYLDLCFTTLQQIYIDLGECLRILNVATSTMILPYLSFHFVIR